MDAMVTAHGALLLFMLELMHRDYPDEMQARTAALLELQREILAGRQPGYGALGLEAVEQQIRMLQSAMAAADDLD